MLLGTSFAVLPCNLLINTGHLILLETDHNSFTDSSKSQRKQQMAEEMVQTAGEYEEVAAAEAAENFLAEELPENVFGAPKAGAGMWASCLRVMHPTEVCAEYMGLFLDSIITG